MLWLNKSSSPLSLFGFQTPFAYPSFPASYAAHFRLRFNTANVIDFPYINVDVARPF